MDVCENMGTSFFGFERLNGEIGVRNYVAVLPTVGCANEVVLEITRHVSGTVGLTHRQGCLKLPPDLEQVSETIIGLGKNPNIAAVLLVSLGCESVFPDKIADEIAKSGKPVDLVEIQKIGGSTNACAKGIEIASEMVLEASQIRRKEYDTSELMLSTKCGASDATSGLASNLAVGAVADKLIEDGGTFILGEVCDIMGSEDVLAARAVTPEVGNEIIAMVKDLIVRAQAVGMDAVGGQLTEGNKRGGLTTVKEKALGAIAKGGSTPVKGTIGYAEKPPGKGLYVMPTPGRGYENLTGVAAAGSQLMLFTTGLGAPEGHPIMPVIKLTGNINTWENLRSHMDFNVSGIIEGTETVEQAGERLYEEMLNVASGKLTKAEILKYNEGMEILTYGPTI